MCLQRKNVFRKKKSDLAKTNEFQVKIQKSQFYFDTFYYIWTCCQQQTLPNKVET